LALVGAVTALACRTGVDVPRRFGKSRLVGAIFGLTPRVHSSGETEQIGRIAKWGDGMVRWLLYEAANVMMTRCKADDWLKAWAQDIVTRRGARRAKTALARRLAVIMRRMWIANAPFSMERPAMEAA
jgi:transposase